jgi:hypothetical protein
MAMLIYTTKVILFALLGSICNATLAFNQPHATVVAAAAQTISQQTDNDLSSQCKQFKHQLEQIRIILTKKSHLSRTYPVYEKKLGEIEKKIRMLQEEYEQCSPATVILGPIGAVATVLKEKKISKNLFLCLQECADIIAQLTEQTKGQLTPIISERIIDKALDQLDGAIENIDQIHYTSPPTTTLVKDSSIQR